MRNKKVFNISLNEICFHDGEFSITEEYFNQLIVNYLEKEYDKIRVNEDEGYFFQGKQLYKSKIVDGSVKNEKIKMIDKNRLLVEATRLFK